VDNTRLVLVIALAFVLLLLWQAWQEDYGPHRSRPPPAAEPVVSERPADLPEVSSEGETTLPQPDAVAPAPGLSAARMVNVQTDTFDIRISTVGAVIERVALPDYPVSVDEPEEPFVFLDNSAGLVFIEQDGLLSEGDDPNHNSVYEVDEVTYRMEPGQRALEVPFRWNSAGRLSVRKVYTFARGSHAIDIRYEITNHAEQPWTGRLYAQLQRAQRDEGRQMVYTFTGAALSSPEDRYQKFDFDDLQEEAIQREIRDGWVAILQHYFVAALIPDPERPYQFYSKTLNGGRYIVGFYGPRVTVPAGAHGTVSFIAYAGPKTQSVLSRLAPGLELTVDYGVLWFIAKPLFWLLGIMHRLTGNWGWSIILLTVLVKVAFFYPSAVGYKSMAKMRKIQPRLVAMRERYAKDRVRMQQAMMELYKEEKINPLSGCLPILIQIPVFIALYWVLLESVELRQAEFVLWLNDLSAPDRFFVLPVIMGVTMYVQQKLNPAPLDPVQQKVMQFLPLIFTVMFAWFPSGLVLYWTVSNILSIVQQWLITRQIEVEQPA
jgi:YidC/Oxa1 family membrane protein insertase